MGVIIKNYIKNLKNEKSHYIFIGFPLIISICVGLTLRGKMFEDYRDTRSRLFAISLLGHNDEINNPITSALNVIKKIDNIYSI